MTHNRMIALATARAEVRVVDSHGNQVQAWLLRWDNTRARVCFANGASGTVRHDHVHEVDAVTERAFATLGQTKHGTGESLARLPAPSDGPRRRPPDEQ